MSITQKTTEEMLKPEEKVATLAKKRYFQINLMNCAGNKTLIRDIAEELKKDYDVISDSLVILIKEKK